MDVAVPFYLKTHSTRVESWHFITFLFNALIYELRAFGKFRYIVKPNVADKELQTFGTLVMDQKSEPP